MWWDGQNLDQDRIGKNGSKWSFRVWNDAAQTRIFFWDEAKTYTGVFLFPLDAKRHISRVRDVIEKLVADPQFRAKHRRPLQFPLERHYGSDEAV